MNSAHEGVLGIFTELDTTIAAVDALRAQGYRDRDLTVFSPLPQHDLEHALHLTQSPVRMFTLVGGLTGTATGFAFGAWTSLDWPLITGGKPIITLPPFVIIAFELTILFGALATVLGLFINARLPSRKAELLYDPSFSAGRFGVLVVPESGKEREIRSVLERAGAAEVRSAHSEVHRATP
ncbi:MAG: DUF3341 domain-containing protein [Longimicrobiales bacterium]